MKPRVKKLMQQGYDYDVADHIARSEANPPALQRDLFPPEEPDDKNPPKN